MSAFAGMQCKVSNFVPHSAVSLYGTVEPLLRHTPRWRVESMHFMGLCPARGEQIRSNTVRKSPFCTTTVSMSPLKHAPRYSNTFSIL